MLAQMVGHRDLETYEDKLAWAQKQIEHAQGTSQAALWMKKGALSNIGALANI